jgi:acetyl-CoA synthetase
MVQKGQIDHLLQESAIIAPPDNLKQAANLQNYEKEYADSINNTEGFWENIAKELSWFSPWESVYENTYPTFKWFLNGKCNITYNALDRHLEHNKNKVAFLWLAEDGSERSFTYGRLYSLVNKFANGLKQIGVQKGDKVVIYMPLTPEGAIAMLACARIGAVHSVVYAGFSVGALADRINDIDAKVLITGDIGIRRGGHIDLKAIADEAIKSCPTLTNTIVWRRLGEKTTLKSKQLDFDELMNNQSPHCDAEIMDSEDPLYVLYTSGTTGKPKGILHVHGGYMVGTYYHFKTFWDIKENDVFWCTSDIGWVVGHSYIVYAPLITGTTTIFREGTIDYPEPDIFYNIIEKYGVNVIFTAPTALRMLMRYGDKNSKKYDLTSLRYLTCAGEPLNPEALKWAYKILCGNGEWGHIVDNWWQTETGAPCIGTLPIMNVKPGRVGKPLPGVELDIVDNEGTSITEPNKGGLLIIKKPFPHFYRTVYGDPERYAESWNTIPGAYLTGDVALRDEDGYYMVVGRADDVLNVAGHRIGSAEVESALVSHDAVAEAAVIGLPDEIKGEAIKAYVTLMMGTDPSEEINKLLKLHVRNVLGPIAVPSEIDFLPVLPKTRSGKIMRRLLKAQELGIDPGDLTTLEE